MSYRDITYCVPGCSRLDCFRNGSKLKPGFYTISDLSQTNYCPNNAEFYDLPKWVREMTTVKLASEFLSNIKSVFHCEDEIDQNFIDNVSGTSGWVRALKKTQGTGPIVEYEAGLDWAMSDRFTYDFATYCYSLVHHGELCNFKNEVLQ